MGLLDVYPDTYFPLDNHDNARITIDSTHHEVHEGALHEFHYENLAAASGVSIVLHVKTGTINLHTFLEFACSDGPLKIAMYDGATVGTAGTEIKTYNLNRTYPESLETKVYHSSTVGTTGPAFGVKTILATSTVQAKANSAVKEFAERVWAPSKDYIVTMTPVGVVKLTVDGIIGEHE